MSYCLIKSGENQRRKYQSLNNSPLFQNLPRKDFAHEQKSSYYQFLNHRLNKLISFYFPVNFNDHNNTIKLNIENLRWEEPEVSEEVARDDSLTWNYTLYFDWIVDWNCETIQLPLVKEKTLVENIQYWVEESFKIGKFTLRQKPGQKWEIKEKKESTQIVIKVKEKKEDYF